MDTIGSLMDKLSIINIKLWFTLEKFRDDDKDVVFEAVKNHNVLNAQRNALIREIDEKINHIVSSGEAQTLHHAIKTYVNK
ncbi:MAG TPA: hypothetical protein VII94_00790 [Candidatus Saccharimonadales bacterium]